MKLLPAILLGWLLGAHCLSAQQLNQINPQQCSPYHGDTIKCVTTGSRLESGGGKNFGPWFTLTSTAPKPGYTVKSAVGHIGAIAKEKKHMCGVTDYASPIAKEGPTAGYRTGTSHWAQCYIAEEDATHVVLKVNLQGEEPGFLGGGEGKLYWDADLTVIYVPPPPQPKK